MSYYVGLDVAQNLTAVCAVDHDGTQLWVRMVETDPEAISHELWADGQPEIIGLETGTLSAWLVKGLEAKGHRVVCIDAGRLRQYGKASAVKSDKNDAVLIAQAVRSKMYRAVHVKSTEAMRLRVLLNHRNVLSTEIVKLELVLRATLKSVGIRFGRVSKNLFEGRIKCILKDRQEAQSLRALCLPILAARNALLREHAKLDRALHKSARNDPVIVRLMTIPGVGPVTAAAYRATIDDPSRFEVSRQVGPAIGLTPFVNQSGAIERRGRITKRGDSMLRAALYTAAKVHLYNGKHDTDLRRWGRAVAERRGTRKAIVALARKLAIVMHRMWITESNYRATPTASS